MRSKVNITCLAAGVFVLMGGIAQAQRSSLSYSDRNFMREAARGGVAEVQLGELAAQQGSRESVRAFGQRMVDDHSKAGEDLMQLAQNKGISLPTEMNDESRALYRRLRRLHGAAFDNAYIRAMREDHAKDVAAFRREANYGRDGDVRAFADRTLPIVRDHYKTIVAMSGSYRSPRAHRTYPNGY